MATIGWSESAPANGDNLGYDLPVAKMTPDMVREKLEKPVPDAGAKGKERSGS